MRHKFSKRAVECLNNILFKESYIKSFCMEDKMGPYTILSVENFFQNKIKFNASIDGKKKLNISI